MEFLLFSQVLFGSILGGVKAGQDYCSTLQQAEDIKKQTAEYIKQQENLFDERRALDEAIQEECNTVKNNLFASINTLQNMKQEYAVTMMRLQLGIACVIIIVFMLLLAKKLKIF